MKSRFFFILITTAAVPWGLLAAEMTTNELKSVAAALQPVLEKLEPKPEITYPSGSAIVIAYRSQLYKIHSRSKTGEISTNAHDEIGPGFKGFVLRVHLQDKAFINQLHTPFTKNEPYWRTDFCMTPLPGTEKKLFWTLSYGSRTDTNLLAQLRRKLGATRDGPYR